MSTTFTPVPTARLTVSDYANSAALANWIALNTPCYAGDVPVEYTMEWLALFRRHSVPDSVVKLAFEILAAKGMTFAHPGTPNAPLPAPPRDSGPPQKQMRGITEGEQKRIEEHGIEELERRYVLAIKTNNMAGAEAIFIAALNLMLGIAKGYGKTVQARNQMNEKAQEWEEFNTAVDQAMDRARSLQSNMRHITREELKEMRYASTPDALRRIVRQVGTRVVNRNTNNNRSRRARK